MMRLLVAGALALAFMSVPVVRVAACSCAMGETDEQIRAARLAFVGTVVDQRETGARNGIGDAMVEYAFHVERSSAPTSAITVIEAGSGGASCGVSFGNGEEWLIIVPEPSDMGDTHLCAGNLPMADIDAGQRAQIESMLTVLPTEEPQSEAPGQPPEAVIPLVGLGIALVLLAGVGFLAFRRDRLS